MLLYKPTSSRISLMDKKVPAFEFEFVGEVAPCVCDGRCRVSLRRASHKTEPPTGGALVFTRVVLLQGPATAGSGLTCDRGHKSNANMGADGREHKETEKMITPCRQ